MFENCLNWACTGLGGGDMDVGAAGRAYMVVKGETALSLLIWPAVSVLAPPTPPAPFPTAPAVPTSAASLQ